MPQVGGSAKKRKGGKPKPKQDWATIRDPLGHTFSAMAYKSDQRGKLHYTQEANYRGVFRPDKLKGPTFKSQGFNHWDVNPMQRGFTPFKPMGRQERVNTGGRWENWTVVRYSDGAVQSTPNKRFDTRIKDKRPFGSTMHPCTAEFSSTVRCLQHRRAVAAQLRAAEDHKAGPLRSDSCPPLIVAAKESSGIGAVDEIRRCTQSSAGDYGLGCGSTEAVRKSFNRRPGINTDFGGDPATTMRVKFRGMP